MAKSVKLLIKFSAVLVLVFGLTLGLVSTGKAWGVPIISITTVVSDTSVTISGSGFPSDQTFTVRMGAYGTLGIGGVVVGSKEPASGSTFTATYPIPASLMGAPKIAIRLDSPQGYYSYNWFYNNSTGAAGNSTGSTASVVIPTPTFTITSVVAGSFVTVQTSNFPAGQTFTVRMGPYGTAAIGGELIGITSSSAGGSITQTYKIPESLAGLSKIAIRMDSPEGYYAYNWFYNTSTSAPVTAGTTVTPAAATDTSTTQPITAVPAKPAYIGYPTMDIVAVVKDDKVTVHAVNLPAGETITVLMGPFGTAGINGIVITKISSGLGGDFTATYKIPALLYGSGKIAIRMETSSGYYAYNWFYNN